MPIVKEQIRLITSNNLNNVKVVARGTIVFAGLFYLST